MFAFLTGLLLLHPSLAPERTGPWPMARRDNNFASTILSAHNSARARHGAGPLVWDEQLAANAIAYANVLARTNSFQHDSTPGRRRREGENLWMGVRGVYGFDVMMAGFLSEERLFRPGVFPMVSRTGNWSEVAHFTQMIWPSTTAIGCGLASNAWNDFLVCRYASPGNKDGVALR